MFAKLKSPFAPDIVVCNSVPSSCITLTSAPGTEAPLVSSTMPVTLPVPATYVPDSEGMFSGCVATAGPDSAVAVEGAGCGSETGTTVEVRTGCLWTTAEFVTFLQARLPTNCSSGDRKLLPAVSGRQLGVGVWARRAADEQTRARAETAILDEPFMIMHLSKPKCDFPSGRSNL